MVTVAPPGADDFLARCGWQGASLEPLTGDASFRRYYRVRRAGTSAMLMHAPPPHEDPKPFLRVGQWLLANGLRAPAILGDDDAAGYILLEDLGDDRLREHLEQADSGEELAAYGKAVDALVQLQKAGPGPFPRYDMDVYLREVDLFIDWFCPVAGITVHRDSWMQAWLDALTPLLDRQEPGVTVLRDYHAENIMLLPDGHQAIIDFQDALIGHPAYDLVSLLQDARRDVSEQVEAEMLNRFTSASDAGADFMADYARLGAQRNVKIVGIFARLNRRDNKPRYMAMIPRVWAAMERDLAHPALEPVAQWFDANIPVNIRDNFGGELQ